MSHADKVAVVRDLYPKLHPGAAELVPYFDFEHLPEHLRSISSIFHTAAHAFAAKANQGAVVGPEATVALRKLLEAKDCAVRGAL